jgi:pimeloyl-ACP methyl ester carboxylesterase
MRLLRRFADLDFGQVLYREAGTGGPAPLVMLHGAAADGASLAPLALPLAATRRVIVPDLPGCGASDPLPIEQPEIADFADALVALLDTLGIARCDVHGAHLGARVATALALRHPARARRVILDGAGFYDDASRTRMLAHVAPEIVPDAEGRYLQDAHAMCRDYFRYFPWFARDAAHRREGPGPKPDAVHAKLVEVLRNGRTYRRAYHAALRYRMEDTLPRLRHPVLLAAARTDNVFPQRARAAALLPGAATAETPGAGTPAAAGETAAIFAAFLDDNASRGEDRT